MTEAIVIVNGAVLPAETRRADASVVVTAVDASSSVPARIELFGAELDLLVAERSYKEREREGISSRGVQTMPSKPQRYR